MILPHVLVPQASCEPHGPAAWDTWAAAPRHGSKMLVPRKITVNMMWQGLSLRPVLASIKIIEAVSPLLQVLLANVRARLIMIVCCLVVFLFKLAHPISGSRIMRLLRCLGPAYVLARS